MYLQCYYLKPLFGFVVCVYVFCVFCLYAVRSFLHPIYNVTSFLECYWLVVSFRFYSCVSFIGWSVLSVF